MKEIQQNLNKTCEDINRITAYVRTFAHLAEREEGAMIQIDAESFDVAMSDIANTLSVAHFQLSTIRDALGYLDTPNPTAHLELCFGVEMTAQEFCQQILTLTNLGRIRLIKKVAQAIDEAQERQKRLNA